ncbi:hypothetical protein J1N35_010849 [Gossypium stocksii]|uniref:Reverse transcriptase domain-containing protein n=1 Tax=Gossypium stocksii TaxID=47602 RepID=A0A9D3W157_9ROSI|nr:hypothetical protein J1N35_010849 [Gossypium stocksii]
MDWLGHSILSNIDVGKWEPIRLSHSVPPLSYLGFTDDLIIFCNAKESQARILKEVLNNFCYYSRHRINAHKTSVCFSRGIEDSIMNALCNILGFLRVYSLGKYLGVSLFHNRITASTLHFFVHKVRSGLRSWYSNLDMDCMLSDMVTGNGEWNFDIFRLWLPEEIIRRIVGIPPHHSSAGVDRIIWG